VAAQPINLFSQQQDLSGIADPPRQRGIIRDESELEDLLTQPRPALLDFIRSVTSPLLILGAGGKMGPTLAVLAQRAATLAGHRLEVIAVSRFSDESSRRWLESRGVTTISADLFAREAAEKLPDAVDVVYLVGLKFGTSQNPALTWAANTLAPANIAERYASSRLVALSTGNVYPLVSVQSGGAREEHPLTPLGEYSNAAVARERIFEYFSRKHNTRTALLRLSYAVELRYGVLADIASKVHAGEPIDATSGYFNCIWQGDANEMILRALALTTSPPAVFNLSGPSVSVRELAAKFSEIFGRPANLVGTEARTALLSNTERVCEKLGAPPTPMDDIIRWTAHWVSHGGRSLNKPTHFEVRDGTY
jgi:nucleoside-diphosphate-sugar epimerase